MKSFSQWADELADHVGSRKPRPVTQREPADEGDVCSVCHDGYYRIEQEPCYCGAAPAPCSACENAWLECDECGHRPEDDE